MSKKGNNFNKKVQMHLACSGYSPIRPEMCCIYFRNGFAYASDGHILAKNRISEISGLEDHEITALDGKFLHADFYKDMLKYDNIMIAEDGIECSKDNDKVFFYFSTFDKYPDAEKVMQEALNTQTTPLPQVRFDMKIIQRLNKSLFESDKCVATFKGTNKVIVFDSMMEGVSSVGLLMPCYSEDTEE